MPKPYYEADGITLYCGDCRDILPEFPDKSFDLCLTDPPYGVELEYEHHVDSFEAWKSLVDVTIPEMCRLSSGLTLVPTSKVEGERHLFINHVPLWRICWFKGASCTRSPIGFKDWETVYVYGDTRGVQVHDYFSVHANSVREEVPGHPCPKPIGWALWLAGKFSKPQESILDPFCGSGTTLVAAKQLGRKAVGIELSEKYCEIAVKRLSQMELFGASA